MGYSPERVTKMFQQRFEGIRRHQIHRLVITEMGHIAEQATSKAYEESGIEEYEYMATLESHTCEVCSRLDGKIFKMSEKREGINYPLIHPHCRCTTVPHIKDLPNVKERWIRDPETGKGKIINNMSFDEWKKYVDKDYLKSRPYINNSDIGNDAKVPNNIKRRTMQKAEEVIENNKFLKSRFNSQKLNIHFDESLFIQHPNAAGVTPPNIDKTIELNPSIHKSKKIISDYVKQNDGQFVSVKPSEIDTYPIVHELGHILHNELWKEYEDKHPNTNESKSDFVDTQIKTIYNIYEKEYGTKVTKSKLPSIYSSVTNNEAFAEFFTISQIGYESNKWNVVMKKYLRKVNK
ncbi:minor capsid protein [Companilactobacillus farciminis]|uniref:minor capsid protein n=1 Tax=Companilactobacillus farciminis TaxID=1612 RepID=UPI001916A4E1|nr:minor capsid protein [Companilactobacillus farciminis]